MDRSFRAVIWSLNTLVVIIFSILLLDIFWKGLSGINFDFLIHAPENAGRNGGIGPIIASTLLLLCVAVVTTLPLGTACAVWMTDYSKNKSSLAHWTSISLNALAGVPSIVFGLFGNAFFSSFLGLGFSILSGGLTLACMALPLYIQTTAKGLEAVGQDLRKQGAALGMTRLTITWRILLPAAKPAIIGGILLATGRALAETAALVFTSGYSDRWPKSFTDGGRSLSLHIYDVSMNIAGGDQVAYASALTLMTLIVIINAGTIWISESFFKP